MIREVEGSPWFSSTRFPLEEVALSTIQRSENSLCLYLRIWNPPSLWIHEGGSLTSPTTYEVGKLIFPYTSEVGRLVFPYTYSAADGEACSLHHENPHHSGYSPNDPWGIPDLHLRNCWLVSKVFIILLISGIYKIHVLNFLQSILVFEVEIIVLSWSHFKNN